MMVMSTAKTAMPTTKASPAAKTSVPAVAARRAVAVDRAVTSRRAVTAATAMAAVAAMSSNRLTVAANHGDGHQRQERGDSIKQSAIHPKFLLLDTEVFERIPCAVLPMHHAPRIETATDRGRIANRKPSTVRSGWLSG
jgi:hypothetical protein